VPGPHAREKILDRREKFFQSIHSIRASLRRAPLTIVTISFIAQLIADYDVLELRVRDTKVRFTPCFSNLRTRDPVTGGCLLTLPDNERARGVMNGDGRFIGLLALRPTIRRRRLFFRLSRGGRLLTLLGNALWPLGLRLLGSWLAGLASLHFTKVSGFLFLGVSLLLLVSGFARA